MKKMMKKLIITTLSIFLCACSGFFDKDNTLPRAPLAHFSPEAKVHLLWSTSTGWGSGNDFYTYVPAVTDNAIYTASKNGDVIATRKTTGKAFWRTDINIPISAGPAATNQVVIVGSRKGDIFALHAENGKIAWKTHTSSEILAAPAIGPDLVLIKSIDGRLSAFSLKDGHALWHYQQAEPTLILRGASAPKIGNGIVISGFANGNLAKLTLHNGSLLWLQPIAMPDGSFAIQRMIDIDADPIIFGNRVYAATYQGQIAALDLSSGQILWSHALSSFTGMAIDNNHVYITDAKSHLWAFNKNTGKIEWQQTQLEARNLSGPALTGNHVIVGDAEGYLHWLNKNDGHFVARTRVDLSGIFAAPVTNNNIIYVVTKDGQLAAYTTL
ncbi:MAG: bamB [Gammaproteobacteria bacterium]|jgi:outer membrane protein assembly factor BamB|nr:bamB [Gammaproteobacteria bacterium]